MMMKPLIWSLLVLATVVTTGNALRSWANKTRSYYVSRDPLYIPFISKLIGPLIPLPEMQPLIINGYRTFNVNRLQSLTLKNYVSHSTGDHFFCKPEEDWSAYQPIHQGGNSLCSILNQQSIYFHYQQDTTLASIRSSYTMHGILAKTWWPFFAMSSKQLLRFFEHCIAS